MLGLRKFRVYEPSMEPSIPSGSLVLTERLSLFIRRPRAGDVMVVRHGGISQIKRLIGEHDGLFAFRGDNYQRSTSFFTDKDHILGRVFRILGG